VFDVGVTGIEKIVHRTLVDALEQQDLDLALVQGRFGHGRFNPFVGARRMHVS
jgi:hypothetical protein